MLDNLTTENNDRAVHSIAHSVAHLDQLAPNFGGERRRIHIVKCRGQACGGYTISTSRAGGVEVFPRLVAAEGQRDSRQPATQRRARWMRCCAAGYSGSSTLVIGPSGTGKSLLVMQFLCEAVRRGKRVACSSSTRNWACCSRAPRGWASISRALRDSGRCHRADGRSRAVARRVRPSRANARPAEHPDRRHRQPERLSGRHARGGVPPCTCTELCNI